MPTHATFNLLNSINEAVFVVNQQLEILFVNHIFEKLTGYSGQSVLGRKCYDILMLGSPCVLSNSHCPVLQIFSGKSPLPDQYFQQIHTKDGLTKKVRLSAAPVLNDQRLTAVTMLIQDITVLYELQSQTARTKQQLEEELTRRQQIEVSLRHSESMYRAMFEHTGTAMLVINQDRTITMANQEFEHMTGYKLEQIVGKATWDQFVHPDDLAQMLYYHEIRRKAKNNAPKNYEFKLIHAQGYILDIFYTVGMIPGTMHSIGSMIDITSRKNIERRLQDSEERYRLLLENIEDVFYEVDLNGNFTYINAAVNWVFGGYTQEEMIGLSFRNIVDKENEQKVFQAYNKVFTSGVPERGFAWSLLKPDGQKKDVEVSISPIRDNQDRIIGFRGTARDITERKKTEERLRYLSLHDSLTGLYNRAFLERRIQRFQQDGYFPVSVICADLDDLKVVNDNMGHLKGDELLISAGQIIKSAVRNDDVVARIGGDEFAVLLPKTDAPAARSIYQRIQAAIERHNQQRNGLPISISLGVATSKTGESILQTYKRADDKMYEAKRTRQLSQRYQF